MKNLRRWIELQGAVNVRDLGGLATTSGSVTRHGRVLRSDNLQDLTPSDVATLVGTYKVRHVVDLRSLAEVALEGPGPLARAPEVTVHHHTLYAEGGEHTDVDADRVLPWQERDDQELRVTGYYYGYLRDRPDSVLGALRTMAYGDGAVIVHCAAGKDRTGVLSALALSVAGATRAAIVEDYTVTGERLAAILTRLRGSDTYRADLDSRPADDHRPRAQYILQFLDLLDARFGGPLGWLAEQGWTSGDTTALRARLHP